MTDNEIIKALECCITDKGDDCESCPYSNIHYEQGNGGCCNKLHKDTLYLIKCQQNTINALHRAPIVIKKLQAEIEKLNIKIDKMRKEMLRIAKMTVPTDYKGKDDEGK